MKPLLALFALVLPALHLPAADKPDLKRVTPVPATEQIPVADFFRLPVLRNPSFNPAGTQIAALVSAGEDKTSVMVYDFEKKTFDTVHGAGDRDIYSYAWLNDQRFIFTLAAEKLYGAGLFTAEVGRLNRAYPLLQFCGVNLVGIPEKNPLRPLIWMVWDMEDGRDRGVVVVNTDLNTGPMNNLRAAGAEMADLISVRESNERHVVGSYPLPEGQGGRDYLSDRDGQLAFGITGEAGFSTLHRWVGGNWQKCPLNLEETDIIGSGNQPGEIVVRSLVATGQPRPLQFMDAATGQPGEVLVQDKGYDFSGGWLYRDPATHEIIGAVYERSGPHAVWFNQDYRDIQKLLDGNFKGLVVRILGSDRAGRRFLVSTFSDRQPPVYHWFDREKRALGLVKNSAPWIDPARMQPMNIIKFKTRDDHQLDAYLTLPTGASKTNPPPLVVLSHGGPWARDSWGYNGEVQFLASRGYAVLQTNYRGSLGSDWMFPEAELSDFRKMHDDVTDAAKTVIASGLVDPARVAIMGGSFGGYLAISGVVNEPALYRCAVTIAGVFDWGEFLREKKSYQFEGRGYDFWKKKLGDPQTEAAKFEAISPLRHADRIRVPVLVAHGKDDPVVDIRQSRELIARLEKSGVPHEVILTGGEGHGMLHLKNQAELYTRIEAFFAKNLMTAK